MNPKRNVKARETAKTAEHVRISRDADALYAPRVSAGNASLVLACDMMVAASPAARSTMRQELTRVVLNTHLAPHAKFVLDPVGASFGEDAMLAADPAMAHSLLSAPMNLGLLHPLEVVRAAEAAYRDGSLVRGRVLERVKGGLTVDIGVRAFLPGSLVDMRPTRRLEDYIGEEVEGRIINFDRRRANVVLSRKAVLEQQLKGLDGMLYFNSNSSNGSASITVMRGSSACTSGLISVSRPLQISATSEK